MSSPETIPPAVPDLPALVRAVTWQHYGRRTHLSRVEPGYRVVCGCGWESTSTAKRDEADAEHSSHLADEVRAALLSAHRDMLAAQLREVASARREYLTNAPTDAAKLLENEVAVLDCAARIVEGDLGPLYGLMPSWRWTDEMNARLRERAATAPADGPAPTGPVGSAPAVGREAPQTQGDAEAVPLETLTEELGATDPVFRAAAERTALIERLAEGHWRLDWPHQGYGWADENRPTAEAHRRGARRCLDAIALAGLRLVPADVPDPQRELPPPVIAPTEPAEPLAPARAGRFEELLAAEHEQFDRRGELLRSIVEYHDATSTTVAALGDAGTDPDGERKSAQLPTSEEIRTGAGHPYSEPDEAATDA